MQSEECQINNCLAEGTFKVTVDVLLIRLSQCSAEWGQLNVNYGEGRSWGQGSAVGSCESGMQPRLEHLRKRQCLKNRDKTAEKRWQGDNYIQTQTDSSAQKKWSGKECAGALWNWKCREKENRDTLFHNADIKSCTEGSGGKFGKKQKAFCVWPVPR